MSIWKKVILCLAVGSILAAGPVVLEAVSSAGGKQQYRLPGGVYVDLTRDFYEALRGRNQDGKQVYSNSMSDEYLRQIAVSSRFAVKTNLRIIKQQAQIIRLLESIRDKKK